jgi:hypothetical protein
MLGRIFRVLSGFILACLAAGLVKVLFAFPPSDNQLALTDIIDYAMPIATHSAIFAAPFALIAIAIAEWQRWRDWAYYAASGLAIALIGFFAQYQSETAVQGWSILNNNYPLIAFLTSGLVSGLVYWLFSGRLAGHHLLTTHGRHGVGHGHDHKPANNKARA